MKSRTVPPFWEMLSALPPEIQALASKTFRIWQAAPWSYGLHFKRVCANEPIYSVRIGRNYRALGLLEDDTVYWYFIGNHDAYDQKLQRL